MATWGLQRFGNPETLRGIEPKRLVKFLKPYRRYFLSCGVTFPRSNIPLELDYDALVQAFLTPTAKTPRELIDALYFVDEMSTPEGMSALVDEVKRLDLRLDEGVDHTPEDVAVQVWLLDRNILERKHAENHVAKVHSFDYYQMNSSQPPPFKRPSLKAMEALAAELDVWFEKKMRGRGSRVFIGEGGGCIWFLVRHAEPFKREESMEGSKTLSVCFRPVKYDTLIYTPTAGEIRINARLKGEKDLYRKAFGKHLFGDEQIFPGIQKYTLDPLREHGVKSLACADIEGIDDVKLYEVQLFYPGTPWESVTRRSDDLFHLFASRSKGFPEGGQIKRASFKVSPGSTGAGRNRIWSRWPSGAWARIRLAGQRTRAK
jgi:hypothetical protein